jgi:polysaccharide export outer membrane protein
MVTTFCTSFLRRAAAGGLLCALAVLAAPAFAQQGKPAAQPAASYTTDGYRLGTGDIISIRVYGEDDLTREKVKLNDTGTLTMPFGDVVAHGKTAKELETAIADGLRGKFLVNPRASVSIEEYRPFFIYGQVEKPGGYPYQPGLNIRKAVSIAGGFKDRASMSKIFVVREHDKNPTPAKVDLSAVIGPGDTITVEESFF